MPVPVPAYPVIHVTVAADGSAHLNLAGEHRDYPAGDVERTREQIIAYAAQVAAGLGRGVRMSTVDPGGNWQLAVFPDGDVQALEPASTRRRRGRGTPTVRIPAAEPSGTPAPAAAHTPAPATPAPPSRRPVARLKFTTGDVAEVADRAIIGREPESAHETAWAGWQKVAVVDDSKTMSRIHAELRWDAGRLWVSDRASGNGSSVRRADGESAPLRPGEAVELHDGDTVGFGPVIGATVTISFRNAP